MTILEAHNGHQTACALKEAPRCIACSFVSLRFCAFAAPSFLPSYLSPRQSHAPYPAKWEPKAQEIFLSYWTVESGWSTELEIRNNVAWRDLTVTPVLRTAAGAEIALQPVTVHSEHVAAVDLREALLSVAPSLLDQNGSFGSVVYRYAGNSQGNIFGASMVRRNESPIGFHFDGEPIEKGWSPGAMESVWWLPRATASDYLILANASTQPLSGSLVVSDAADAAFGKP